MDNKYELIAAYIKDQLHSGSIKAGDKLPSIREISKQFSCSKNTAIRAYENLEKEQNKKRSCENAPQLSI